MTPRIDQLVQRLLRSRAGRDSGGTLNFCFPFLRFMNPVSSPKQIIKCWGKTLSASDPVPYSVYVHIPFCPEHCNFCAFATTYGLKYDRALDYLGALEREIRAWSNAIPIDRMLVRSIFVGGGTPNYLRPADFGRLCERLRNTFSVSSDTEWTVELYPRRDLVEPLLPVLRDHGVTRISHCAQDFNDAVLRDSGRQYSAQEALALGRLIRGAGFDMNVDLMIGMPPQSLRNATANFEAIEILDPMHVTLNPFSTRAPGIPWAKPKHASRLHSQVQIREQYDYYRSWLLDREYAQITKCNFERAGSRPFLYETLVRQSMPRLGLGLGALSFTGDTTYRNAGTLSGYLERASANGFAVEHAYKLNDADRLRARMFFGALSGRVADVPTTESGGPSISPVLDVLEDHLLIERNASGFNLTEQGMWHVGLVQRAFLPPWVLERYSSAFDRR